MKKILLSIILLFAASMLFAKAKAKALKDMTFGTAIVSEITSIYDADTFRVNIENWPDIIGYRMSIRVNGIDAPEIRGKCPKEKRQAQEAKQITVKFLRSSQVIELRNMRRGKYFRIIADVYGDGKSLVEHLLKSGLVREYSGGSRRSWCDDPYSLKK